MYKKCFLPITALFFLMTSLGLAQSTDIFRVDYLRIPANETGISTSRYKFLLNVPIKVGWDKFLVTGAEYNQFDIDFSENLPFDQSELDTFHVVDLNLGYITRWNENWRLITIVTPRLASNFTNGISGDDFFFNATATFWKEQKEAERPFRIILGLTFNSTTGLPFPLPLISYYERFHPKWSFTLGIPRMNFKYHPAEKHTVQLALLLDGYFINIQDDILLPDSSIGSRISLSSVVGALGYQYNITKSMSFYTLLGRSFEQEGVLRNDKRDDVFLLNNKANFYLRTGFKISIF